MITSLRTPLGAAVLVGLLGLAISLAGIGTPSIWYDEAATIISSTRTWPELMRMIGTVDAVHALYYALIHVVFDVFGYSPISLRVPSAIATAAAGSLTVLLANELFRLRVAVIAGVVFALLPRTTWMGTEGRSYALTATLAVALTFVLVRALRSPSRRRWILYGALVVVSCLVFLYLALIVVAHAVAVAIVFAVRRRRARSSTGAWVVTTAVATALIIPFALMSMGQSQQLHWLDPIGKNTLRQVLVGQWFYTSIPFAVVGWALILGGCAVLLWRVRQSRQSRRDPLAAAAPAAPAPALLAPALLIPLLLVPTLALLATTALYLPIYTPRYLSMGLPFVAVLMALAIESATARVMRLVTKSSEGRRMILAATLACALIATLAVPQIVEQRQPQAKENTSWRAVADSIASARQADGPDVTTAIVYGGVQFHPIATARVIAYSYPEAFEGTVDVTLDTPAGQTGRLWETTKPLFTALDRLGDADVVYLLASFARDIRPATTRMLEDAGWRVDDAWDITDVHVVRYVRG
ncbi:mannosyltransferase [Glaciihabitans tibetensis]|uniref:Mannosyltransferase n=1 Tax=Glaciihabitans tibetensis TaxID=1266600 RepID=A0A2T0VAS5_9MICO|nr:glycosyltransferase family 39 protein [Glaciihabitans tibetensis]PRY67296.1 mannosyltransferase [Glaciihabitans tibetensis]